MDLNGTLGVQVVSSARRENRHDGRESVVFHCGHGAAGPCPVFPDDGHVYVKIVVVTSLVRNALGVQQVPPAMVMNGLASS